MAYGIVNVSAGATAADLEAIKGIAESANQKAGQAITASGTAEQKAQDALDAIDAFKPDVKEAKDKAQEALDKANAASAKADNADTNAAAALEAANAAKQLAQEAKDAADNAQDTADGLAAAVKKLTNSIGATPSQNGTLTYNGSPQQPVWNSYDEEQLDIGGTTEGTDAGEYEATFTPKADYTWSDGTNTARTVTWKIGRKTVPLPTQKGTLTYSGDAQSPEWNNYVEDELTLSGDTSKTTAGTYKATFTPTKNYQWSDGTFTGKDASWTIKKAAGSVSVESKLTLGPTEDDVTTEITREGDGEITVSGGGSISTGKVSGTTLTITSKNHTNGSDTYTVNVAEGTNHLATSATVTVTAQYPQVYGVTWDGTATTKWSRTGAAAQFKDPVAQMGSNEPSSPFDNISPWKDMTIVSDSEAGELVKIPKFWYKLESNGANGISIQIADGPEKGFEVSPAHMDRGDGKGERDVVYVGRYHCASDYKSTTGVNPAVSKTRDAFRKGIAALGETIWQWDYAMMTTIQLLYLVEYADWNSQAVIGRGCSASSALFNMGATKDLGYHTATTGTTRDAYGATSYRNIEGLWDNVFDWVDGCYNASPCVYLIKDPSKFSDTAGGTSVGVSQASGWPSKFEVTNKGGYTVFIPTVASGSDSSYSCDGWSFSSGSPAVFHGGYCGQYTDHGLFCMYYTGASHSDSHIGARLQKLP